MDNDFRIDLALEFIFTLFAKVLYDVIVHPMHFLMLWTL